MRWVKIVVLLLLHILLCASMGMGSQCTVGYFIFNSLRLTFNRSKSQPFPQKSNLTQYHLQSSDLPVIAAVILDRALRILITYPQQYPCYDGLVEKPSETLQKRAQFVDEEDNSSLVVLLTSTYAKQRRRLATTMHWKHPCMLQQLIVHHLLSSLRHEG